MKCPIDDTVLSVSSREGVEIDFCPQCRGVWLDRGELDKILERAATSMAPSARDDRGRDDRGRDDRGRDDRYDDRYDDRRSATDRDDRDPRKRRRRGFLDDLFDFD